MKNRLTRRVCGVQNTLSLVPVGWVLPVPGETARNREHTSPAISPKRPPPPQRLLFGGALRTRGEWIVHTDRLRNRHKAVALEERRELVLGLSEEAWALQ
eukprot:Opistho-1_new@38665